MFKRIALFLITNLAVLLVLGLVLNLLGLNRIPIGPEGGLDYGVLLASAAVVGFVGSFMSLLMSKFVAKMTTGARVIEQPRSEEESWLLETVRRLSQKAGIGMPDVAIFDSPDMNAFATGARRNHALVAVSNGLLRGMTRDEAEAVIGHEISHVANGDMVTLTLVQGVVNTFVIFLSRVVGYLVDNFVFRGENENRRGVGPGFFIVSMVCQIVFGIAASMIVAWFSRRREFRADAGGGALTTRDQMARALDRLKRAHEPSALPEAMAAFGIHGGKPGGFARLFMSHPPLDERIAALRGTAVTPSDDRFARGPVAR